MLFCNHVDVEQSCDSHKMLRLKRVAGRVWSNRFVFHHKMLRLLCRDSYISSAGLLGRWALLGLLVGAPMVRDRLGGGRLPWALSGLYVLTGGFLYLVLLVS